MAAALVSQSERRNNRPIYPSEVLSTGSLDKLLQSLRESYDYVIVDLSAVAPSADARAAVCAFESLLRNAHAGRGDAFGWFGSLVQPVKASAVR
jgi:cellulose biosynthesis protein BcsQ